MKDLKLPLMSDNISRDDIDCLVEFLQQEPIPRLTNGPKVVEFEKKWSEWLGVKHSVFVNSGTAANELTMLALKYMYPDGGDIIVPPLTWISDINSILFADFNPVFVDINLKNLSFDLDKLEESITDKTKAIFITHVLGLNALSERLLKICEDNDILLIEDVCESHGATYAGSKVGSVGFASNFSFYFAHHMSTIEGGMISTNNDYFYQLCRSLRSHGMTREFTDEKLIEKYKSENEDLSEDFIFIGPAHNFRSTEINAVLGLCQLQNLDSNNQIRIDNFKYFVDNLKSKKFYTDFQMDGQCNYAFILIMKEADFELRNLIEKMMNENGIEFRRGLSGGGNQMRQPYFKSQFEIPYEEYPIIEHVHNFSWYIGNYPSLEREKIDNLIGLLNETK
jgi:CDP-6-deoxy-D-xylo-4-hexulose-3-dehydrase